MEARYQPAELPLHFRVEGREDAALALIVAEAAGFAEHHELLGAGECDAATAVLGVCSGGGVVDGVPDEGGDLRFAHGEGGAGPLGELAVYGIWREEE